MRSANVETDPAHPAVTTRRREKEALISYLQPGHIVQVCGPPMVGKATLVEQTVWKMCQRSYGTLCHVIDCGDCSSFQELLSKISRCLCPRMALCPYYQETLTLLRSILESPIVPSYHNILIFQKCERFRVSGDDHQFLRFLKEIVHPTAPEARVSAVFTTYRRYRGRELYTVEVDFLTDPEDVSHILEYFAPDVSRDITSEYVDICLSFLPIPVAIRRLAEELISEGDRIPPEDVLKYLDTDTEFMQQMFGQKVPMVQSWLPQDKLDSIIHFSHSIHCSFTKSYLEFVISDQRKTCKLPIKYLLDNYVIRKVTSQDSPAPSVSEERRTEDGDVYDVDAEDVVRYAVHPLVIYYYILSRSQRMMVLQGQLYDQSCNRYTEFLLRVLRHAETSALQTGRRDSVLGCLSQEWPHIKHVIEMALHCNTNTYKAFLKVKCPYGNITDPAFSLAKLHFKGVEALLE